MHIYKSSVNLLVTRFIETSSTDLSFTCWVSLMSEPLSGSYKLYKVLKLPDVICEKSSVPELPAIMFKLFSLNTWNVLPCKWGNSFDVFQWVFESRSTKLSSRKWDISPRTPRVSFLLSFKILFLMWLTGMTNCYYPSINVRKVIMIKFNADDILLFAVLLTSRYVNMLFFIIIPIVCYCLLGCWIIISRRLSFELAMVFFHVYIVPESMYSQCYLLFYIHWCSYIISQRA